MNESPLVSVIALCYNQEKYCKETLDSIYRQDYDNTELILIDNGSTDCSGQILGDWIGLHEDLDIKFIKNELNVGIPKAVNIGLSNVKGKYIAMIACDDIMLPTKLSIQVAQLENLSEVYGLTYSDAIIINNDGKSTGSTWLEFLNIRDNRSGDLFERLIYRNHILPPTLLFRSTIFETVGLYDEDLTFEDYDMILRIARGHFIAYTDTITAKYRRHSLSASAGIHVQHADSYIRTLVKHINIKEGYDSIIKNRIRRIVFFSLAENFDEGRTLLDKYQIVSQFGMSATHILKSRIAMKLVFIITYPYRKMTWLKKLRQLIGF